MTIFICAVVTLLRWCMSSIFRASFISVRRRLAPLTFASVKTLSTKTCAI